mmetsp:Transcript_892/g.2199  ORF Transcript_892/g.2199 Transcript_892/m.2199 type:complete len:206 (+) Transcript_892:552-1169(+)
MPSYTIIIAFIAMIKPEVAGLTRNLPLWSTTCTRDTCGSVCAAMPSYPIIIAMIKAEVAGLTSNLPLCNTACTCGCACSAMPSYAIFTTMIWALVAVAQNELPLCWKTASALSPADSMDGTHTISALHAIGSIHNTGISAAVESWRPPWPGRGLILLLLLFEAPLLRGLNARCSRSLPLLGCGFSCTWPIADVDVPSQPSLGEGR